MTLTLNPSTSIRPLGEEHLRMFRRMTQDREIAPRVTIPKRVYQRAIFSRSKVISDEAESTAKSLGGRLASIIELAADPYLAKRLEHFGVFVDWRGAPQHQGYYRIDREEVNLKPISEKAALKLYWKEYLYASPSVSEAIKEKRPLEFKVANFNGRLIIELLGYYTDLGTRVAFVKRD